MAQTEVKNLKPALLWKFFDELTKTPRPSYYSEKVVEYLVKFAKSNNLEYQTDAANNVLIKKPATKGLENRKTIILQSHTDIVDVAEDKKFDFKTSPLATYIENGWVRADKTTLGADNGIGVAAQLAVLASKDIAHPPLVCLFTSDEEVGLDGAKAMSQSWLVDGEILLNLDSEEFGEFCIGCAGGVNTEGVFKYKKTSAPKDFVWLKVDVAKLKGGHSGCDIHLGRGNAIKILTRYLWALQQKYPLLIAEIEGGVKHNAIPNKASAVFGLPPEAKHEAITWCNELQHYLEDELAKVEDYGIYLTSESEGKPATCIDFETGKHLLNTLYSMPHGVIGMSRDIEGLVETSTNLAIIKMTENDTVSVLTSQRSAKASLKTDVSNQVKAVFLQGGATVGSSDGYPNWQPNTKSEILTLSKSLFKKMFGKDPKVVATHGGLECGLFLEKNPKLDMVSFGPTIVDAHSINERVEIESVEKWWALLVELLKEVK